MKTSLYNQFAINLFFTSFLNTVLTSIVRFISTFVLGTPDSLF